MTDSLKKRLAMFLILPAALLLAGTGFGGFIYARSMLLDQWQQGAVLRLERAAHFIDMRLGRPAEWIEMFHETAEGWGGTMTREFILSRLREVDGVTGVELEWNRDFPGPQHGGMHGGNTSESPMMQFKRGGVSEVTPPGYDAEAGRETVALVSDLKNSSGIQVGRLEVSVSFDYLMKDIERLGWWESQQACLVDAEGRYLAHSRAMEGRSRLGETGDPVEEAVFEKMQEENSGTHLGPGHPPDRVSGFYRLERAPWVLIMYAPGEEILAPIIRFRLYYAAAGGVCIALILFLIQFVGGRVVTRIRRLSNAVQQVAKGDYTDPLPVTSGDEIGQLETGFNEMVEGLKERDFVRDTFGRYVDREIARELLDRPEAGRLGGQKREVAILMSDIRDFTAVAESLSPEATISILNHYFSHMIEVIKEHRGIIVDFYGDGVLVFFDPRDGPLGPAASRAVRCSMEMQARMQSFNSELRKEGLPELQTGIGIHAGQVVVGNIGSSSRAKYGIVGLAVNVTQRIQAEAEGGQVVISEPVYGVLSDRISIEKSFSPGLKGVHGKVVLYVLKGFES
ncbi:MAG: adenylate/guanylate cyclase domain-containing protein [Desulfosalsimonas sp.]